MFPYPVYHRSGINPLGCIGCLSFVFIFMGVFFVFSLAILVIVGIGYMVLMVGQWLTEPQSRLFGAQPVSRWTDAYEQALFLIEQNTGIDTNSSPLRLTLATFAITLMPIVILAMLLPIFSPLMLGGLAIIGLGLGAATSQTLTSPYPWYTSSKKNSSSSKPPPTQPEDAILLEQDDW